MNLNEARKLAGLPEIITESSMVMIKRYEDSLFKLQKAFTTDSNLYKGLEKDGADMSYFKDIEKALNKIEDDLTELQKSFEITPDE